MGALHLLADTAWFSLSTSWRRSSPASSSVLPPFARTRSLAAQASSGRRQVEPPNLEQLCEKACLNLTPEEIADFTPKIASVVDWFSQLQDVDLENVRPAIRVGVDVASRMRADEPMVFGEREAMLAGTPELEGPYLKVPKILKENVE